MTGAAAVLGVIVLVVIVAVPIAAAAALVLLVRALVRPSRHRQHTAWSVPAPTRHSWSDDDEIAAREHH